MKTKTLENAQTNNSEWGTMKEALKRTRYTEKQIHKLVEAERIRTDKAENRYNLVYNIRDIIQYGAAHPVRSLYDPVWDAIEAQKGEHFFILEGYDHRIMVSNLARVINLTTGQNIKGQLRPDGYTDVTLTYVGSTVTEKLHRLVAKTQCPNNQEKPLVHHINPKKPLNNKASNLVWVYEDEHNELHKVIKTDKKAYNELVKKIKKENAQKVYKIPHPDFGADENFNYFLMLTSKGFQAFKNGNDYSNEILKEIAEGK